jgi:hypothetical protein
VSDVDLMGDSHFFDTSDVEKALFAICFEQLKFRNVHIIYKLQFKLFLRPPLNKGHLSTMTSLNSQPS